MAKLIYPKETIRLRMFIEQEEAKDAAVDVQGVPLRDRRALWNKYTQRVIYVKPDADKLQADKTEEQKQAKSKEPVSEVERYVDRLEMPNAFDFWKELALLSIVGWQNIEDEQGSPIPFTKENLAYLIDNSSVFSLWIEQNLGKTFDKMSKLAAQKQETAEKN